VSDDGAWSLVVIAMFGNPFSPAYARARERGEDFDPLAFSTLNVALYGPGLAKRWCLTERALGSRDRDADGATFGRSSMRWQDGALVVELDERTSPTGRRVRGRAVFHPECHPAGPVALDDDAAHLWWPVAPDGALEVELDEPRVSFRSRGYHDANAGGAPLESAFAGWTWSRAHAGGRTIITYDTQTRDGRARLHALQVERDGGVVLLPGVRRTPLDTTVWGIRRHAHCDDDGRAGASVVRSLEDTPFYARALVRTRLAGAPATAMLETLSADRLRRAWVRFLLQFRMSRGSAWDR